MSRKFDHAVYIDKNDRSTAVLMDINYLTYLFKQNYELFFKKYRENLYCPECMKPQFLLADGQTGCYLRKYGGQEHNNNCSFSLKAIQPSEAQKIANIDNDAIHSRLNQAIKFLLKKEYTEDHPLVVKKTNASISLEPVRREDIDSKSGKYKYIPCKSLTVPIRDDDYQKYMVFYGKVKIEWQTLSQGKRLVIKLCNTSHVICASFINENVYKHMDTSNYESAFIALFTKLVKSKDGRYTNFYIYHSNNIIIDAPTN